LLCLLGLVTILEYKSPVRGSFRPGDLIRLWSYGAVYDAAHLKELPGPSDLTLTLVVPSPREPRAGEAARWLNEWLKETAMTQTNIKDMEGYDLYLKGLPVEKRLEGLSSRTLLSQVAPEERLAGLDRDQQALALPVELLRGLTEAYILSLAPETQEKIRQRLTDSDH
jgi:hypothetical protein